MNTLATAMERADIQELEDAAIELGQAAVRQSLDQPSSMAQYSADAAMADANEVVARAMRRYGRRVWSTHDASVARRIWELLRGLAPDGADKDPSWTEGR
jgi:hypothetical protein